MCVGVQNGLKQVSLITVSVFLLYKSLKRTKGRFTHNRIYNRRNSLWDLWRKPESQDSERPPGQWSGVTGAWPLCSLRKPNHPSYAQGIPARNQTLESWWTRDNVKWMKGYTPNLLCHCSLVLPKCRASKIKSACPFTSQIQAGQDTLENLVWLTMWLFN